MNATWWVFRREVEERRLLLVGALILGALPFAVGLFRGRAGQLPQNRFEVALSLAVVVGGLIAVAVGASVIARDLAERRLGFYFQRPLSGWAIWAGKFSAAAGLSLAAGALIALPAALASLSHWKDLPVDGRMALGSLGSLLVLLGATHAASIILRARTPWLLLDIAGAFAVAFVLILLGRGLLPAGHAWTAGPGSLAPQIFQRGRGLVRIDPKDGRETVIVPTGPDTRAQEGARS